MHTHLANFSDICLEADHNLFHKVLRNPERVALTSPPVSACTHSYSFRTRAHSRQLPDRLSHLVDCSFITRILFYHNSSGLCQQHTYVFLQVQQIGFVTLGPLLCIEAVA